MGRLPELVLTQQQFDELSNYSHSLPTGTTIGKRWKRQRGIDWMVGEYFDVGSETEVGIRWYWAVNEKREPYRID